MKKCRYILVPILILLLLGCGENENVEHKSVENIVEVESTLDISSTEKVVVEGSSSSEESYVSDIVIPEYDGKDFFYLTNNKPSFTDNEKLSTEPFEIYSDLDSLGRCGVAYANICREIMPTEKRGEIGQIKPTGWVQEKYPGLVNASPPYLYNRCHLIAFQLAGENANEKNLITGTRYFNAEIMLPFEDMVADYVKSTNNHVLYRVTPVFEGDNLLCNGVQMEAWSVEDDGEGICFNVFCYNIQPGVVLDYATGESQLDNNVIVHDPLANETPVIEGFPDNDSAEYDYVLNTNTMKFHYPYCSSVSDMKEKNKDYYTGARDELIDKGYTPCGRCEP